MRRSIAPTAGLASILLLAGCSAGAPTTQEQEDERAAASLVEAIEEIDGTSSPEVEFGLHRVEVSLFIRELDPEQVGDLARELVDVVLESTPAQSTIWITLDPPDRPVIEFHGVDPAKRDRYAEVATIWAEFAGRHSTIFTEFILGPDGVTAEVESAQGEFLVEDLGNALDEIGVAHSITLDQ